MSNFKNKDIKYFAASFQNSVSYIHVPIKPKFPNKYMYYSYY